MNLAAARSVGLRLCDQIVINRDQVIGAHIKVGGHIDGLDRANQLALLAVLAGAEADKAG